jgi:iron complex transport system substrate-binding protein
MRVVSLLPGATEVVAVLGALESLVGVTHECDHPAAVASCARVTGTTVDVHADADAVDAQVRAIAAEGRPLFTLDEARIRALRPDVILTQALCDVCAVSESDVRALAARMDPAPRLVTCAATSLDGVFADVMTIGAALGRAAAADDWVTAARARMRVVHETLKAARAPRPRVAVIEWGAPLYAAGHWVPEMVARAGGVDVLATAGSHSLAIDLAAVRAADPEVILFAPCGYDLPRAVAEGERLLADPAWGWARERRCLALDANAFVSRPGPRLIDGVELLARCFTPSLFTPPDGAQARALTPALS